MAQKFLSDIHATAGIKDSSGDLGTSGQVLSSTGSDTNWVNPTVGTTVIYKDSFTATNGQTAFTLANTVDSEDKTQVYIDGAYQSKGGYTVSGTTLTFDTGLETSSEVEVMTFSTATANNAASAVKLDTFTGDGSDLTFVLSEAVVDEKVTQVYINGVYQNKSTYSIDSDLVTLRFGSGNAPPNSSAIEVISFKTITSTDGTLSATTFLGDLNGTINTASTATTQSAGNNSTKISTTAYTDAKVAEAITNGTTGIAPSQDVVFDALALKANIAGPTFTGTPAAPTASAGTNTTQLATTAFVNTGIANIVDSAPGTLNTLNELAAALGDDVNFSTTVTDSIATKLPLAGGTLTGAILIQQSSSTGFTTEKTGGTGSFINLKDNAGSVFIGGVNSEFVVQTPGSSYSNKLTISSGGTATFSGIVSINGQGFFRGDSSGNLRIQGGTTATEIRNNANNSSLLTILNGGDATFSGNITVGDSHFIGDDSYDNLLIQSSSGENLNISSANDVIFYTGGTNPTNLGTQRLRIFNSSGDATFSGKVLLDGTNQIYFEPQSGENNSEAMRILRSADKMYFTYGINANEEAFYFDSSGDTTFSGNVHIDSTLLVQADHGGVQNATLELIGRQSSAFGGDSRQAKSSIYSETYGGAYGANLVFKTNNGSNSLTERLRLKYNGDAIFSGDVGIGTTSPNYQLDIESSSNAIARIHAGVNGSASLRLKNDAIEWDVNTQTNDTFAVYNQTSGTQPFSILPGGNVGIGTASPVAQIDAGDLSGTNQYNRTYNGIKAGRMQYSWYIGRNIGINGGYIHILTNLWMGGSPRGNDMYIMGGFTAKSYKYGPNGYGEGSCMFHNWGGSFPNLNVQNRGNWSTFMQSPYTSTGSNAGYCVLVLQHDYYSSPIIDFQQSSTHYPWREVKVISQSHSTGTSPIY